MDFSNLRILIGNTFVMQAEQIQQSDLLDILFADRNKLYGAYLLRKNYNDRLASALLITLTIVSLALFFYYTYGQPSTLISRTIVIQADATPEARSEPQTPTILPSPPPPSPQIKVRQFTTPVITIDEVADVPSPQIEELETSLIGVIDQTGVDDLGFPAPPIIDDKGIIATPPRRDEEANRIWTKVEIESSYPGGLQAWKRFLLKTTKYPEPALENDIQGTVVMQFVVDETGTISRVKAISGPEELKSEAVRVITKSGKWNPAIQNGQKVPSYKVQPIVFSLTQE